MNTLFKGVRVKWCYVATNEGVELVQVVEDSGSANNWISRNQIERFGLSAKRGNVITSKTLTGEEFSSDRYVDVSWKGKGSHQGTDRFYVAPEKTPIHMLVGHDFTVKYPRAFMDHEPPPSTPQLLTLQSRVKVSCRRPEFWFSENNKFPKADEQQQIEIGRARMEDQASMLERRKRALPAPASRAGTSSTTSSGRTLALISNTSRKRSSNQ